jgi:hypothetical protein
MAGTNALDGAWLRFRRAEEHLTEAHELIREFGKACKNHIVADNDTDPERPTFTLNAPALPVMLPVIISDAVHNMRAALDYIVFELAKKDSGQIQDGTQFLIEDVKADPAHPNRGFDARSRKYLRGLSGKHIGMIEGFQPYKGVDWTKSLRDISNPDKHRELTVIDKSGGFLYTYRGSVDLATQKPLVINPDDWDIDARYAIYVSPPNLSEPALIPSLGKIQLGVCQALELFKAEF